MPEKLNVPGATAEKLYEKAKVWFAATDEVSKDAIASSNTSEQIHGTGKKNVIRARGVGLVGYDTGCFLYRNYAGVPGGSL
ncbi:MAG: hypothetical protein U5K51_10595 [Flavobacteriaceae bacterium]|nr:hypothetical protein [Flavobacteriaceae bacterium]